MIVSDNSLLESIDEVIEQLKEFCSDVEIEEIKEEVNECLEDGMTKKSLMYALSRMNDSSLIKKAKLTGISVKEIFENLAIHCCNYDSDNLLYDDEVDAYEKEITVMAEETEEELYDDVEKIVRTKYKNRNPRN